MNQGHRGSDPDRDGDLVIDADFGAGHVDTLTVAGDAVLAGRVKPLVTSVLPNVAVAFLSVDGDASGSIEGQASTLFGYQVKRLGNQFLLSATADFTPASFDLEDSQAAVAGHLQSIWDSGGSYELGGLFALLGNTADVSPAGYARQLRQLSPDASLAPGARGGASRLELRQRRLQLPAFRGDHGHAGRRAMCLGPRHRAYR